MLSRATHRPFMAYTSFFLIMILLFIPIRSIIKSVHISARAEAQLENTHTTQNVCEALNMYSKTHTTGSHTFTMSKARKIVKNAALSELPEPTEIQVA